MNWFIALDLVLLLVATCRVTRIFTADTIGEWYIREPAEKWAERNDLVEEGRRLASDRENLIAHGIDPDELAIPLAPIDPDTRWRHRLVSGLACPFCIGLYVAIIGVLSLVAVRDWWPDNPVEWWRLLAAPFALNYVAAHINARLDS